MEDQRTVECKSSGGNGRGEAFDPSAYIEHYEKSMYDPLIAEYVGHSDFHNFGYWDEGTNDHHQACRNLMEKLLDFIPEKQGAILDVACGKGATTRYLCKYYDPSGVTGIDLSGRALETARSNAPGCNFVRMDATDLNFDDARFDAVLCVEAAFHFRPRDKFLAEAHRVLKPGGRLVLTDTLITAEAARRRIGRSPVNQIDDPPAYKACLEKAGFGDVEVIDATAPCWKGMFWGAVRFIHKKLLDGEVSVEVLTRFLEPTYGRVPDLKYYLLATGRKRAAV